MVWEHFALQGDRHEPSGISLLINEQINMTLLRRFVLLPIYLDLVVITRGILSNSAHNGKAHYRVSPSDFAEIRRMYFAPFPGGPYYIGGFYPSVILQVVSIAFSQVSKGSVAEVPLVYLIIDFISLLWAVQALVRPILIPQFLRNFNRSDKVIPAEMLSTWNGCGNYFAGFMAASALAAWYLYQLRDFTGPGLWTW